MKIIAVEEHFVTREVRDAWSRLDLSDRDDSLTLFSSGDVENRLEDLSAARLRHMDESGVDVQVISLTTPGVQNLDAANAVSIAQQANDLIAQTVRSHPDRFEGFATLPTSSPTLAARELDRAVCQLEMKGAMLFGRTRSRNLDHPDFTVIYETAAALRVPLYIHPQIPVQAVRDAYYSGFNPDLDLYLATGGLGWHFETGIQVLRLILTGVFDRLPNLQIILGHWGEVVLFYLERIDLLSKAAQHLERPLTDYFRQNVYVSPSGIFSHRYLSWAIDVLGIDRILFSTDYPYQVVPEGGARRFLEAAGLSQADKEKIAHRNWERLVAR
jgi:uncharacterized protein